MSSQRVGSSDNASSETASITSELGGYQVRKAAELDLLRKRFDERLASLKDDDAADRLRSVMDRPVILEGHVIAGTGR
jgi:hypothetical protein